MSELSEQQPAGASAVAPARGPIGGLLGGLLESLRALLATAAAIAHTRLELLGTELQEEMHRVAAIMVWMLVALLAAGIGLFLAALGVIFIFWDTHRLFAALVVTAVFFTIAATAVLVVRAKIRNKPRLLDATLAELAQDRAQLAARR